MSRLCCLLVVWLASVACGDEAYLRGRSASATGGAKAPQVAASSSHLVWRPNPSFCLSSDGNKIGNGVDVQLWKCDASWRSAGQNFFLDAMGRIRMKHDQDYCVVIDGDSFVDGARVQLWKCDEDNMNQVWSFNNAGRIQAISSPSAMCLVIDANKAGNGAKIQLWSCERKASEQQEWLQMALGASGATMFAVPNEDLACADGWEPVKSSDDCAAGAQALEPGQGCYGAAWKDLVREESHADWPQGCYFNTACQGGCSLGFNPSGRGSHCTTQGDCMRINMICQKPLQF